jgi:catechol 2,3-dioxygenase-like lactoylglutathione lyase family enzyme
LLGKGAMIERMGQENRLRDQKLIAFLPTRHPEQARAFFGETLGLPLVADQLPFALVFDAHGTTLRVVAAPPFEPAPFTVLGWDVEDVEATAKELRDAGVEFQRYENMEQDELGVWTSPAGAKVAWFRDPDGNTLSISQR